jgi:hypothetical protein
MSGCTVDLTWRARLITQLPWRVSARIEQLKRTELAKALDTAALPAGRVKRGGGSRSAAAVAPNKRAKTAHGAAACRADARNHSNGHNTASTEGVPLMSTDRVRREQKAPTPYDPDKEASRPQQLRKSQPAGAKRGARGGTGAAVPKRAKRLPVGLATGLVISAGKSTRPVARRKEKRKEKRNTTAQGQEVALPTRRVPIIHVHPVSYSLCIYDISDREGVQYICRDGARPPPRTGACI